METPLVFIFQRLFILVYITHVTSHVTLIHGNVTTVFSPHGSLGYSFSVGTTSGKDNYTYQFQVCGDAGKTVGAGLVQIDHTEKKIETVLGLYTATQAIGGSKNVQVLYLFF